MGNRKNVLYVEDEPLIGLAINDYFIKNPKYNLKWILNEKEILTEYKNGNLKYYHTYDLILIDRSLRSEMNGTELGRYLRKTIKVPETARMVIFTAETSPDDSSGFGEIYKYIEIMNDTDQTTIFNGYASKQEIFSRPSMKESLESMESMFDEIFVAGLDDFYLSPSLEKAYNKWFRKKEWPHVNDIISREDKQILFLCGRGFNNEEISQIVYGNSKMVSTVENEIYRIKGVFERNDNINRLIQEKFKNDHEFCSKIKLKLYPNEDNPKYIRINKMTLFRIAQKLKIIDDID